MEENAKKQINAHISWWPGTSVEGTKNRFFAQRPGISLKDYKEDKKYEISERTVERLKRHFIDWNSHLNGADDSVSYSDQ